MSRLAFTKPAKVKAVAACDVAAPNPHPDGNGRKIPTRYSIKYGGDPRWLPVWAVRYGSNSGHYIEVGSTEVFLDPLTKSRLPESAPKPRSGDDRLPA